MCVAVLLTTGRNVAAETAVLGQLDAAGTRSIVVRADTTANITTAILGHLDAVDAIDEAIGFGPVTDARNAAISEGDAVPVRTAYGRFGGAALESGARDDTALASTAGAEALGLVDGTGGIITAGGRSLTVTGGLAVPDHAAFLEPLVIVPASLSMRGGPNSGEPLTVLVVLVDQPHNVSTVADVIMGLLADTDPSRVTVETSGQLADLRAAVGGELDTYGRTTVLGILAISAFLVAINLFGLVVLRRKDFGRRRALGATQGLIVVLLLSQVWLLSVVGATLGTALTVVMLAANGQESPGLDFTLAVGIAAVLTAIVAALAPAVAAACRDPLHELRVP
ncbi:FtsX-like permease family protein [Phytoactinopolyspora limicola]|uniref:FtsX-like permease family protein n=1 Tax=Phytoactinopolyspora limicola TaxID=2715536 RepID=UPI00140AB47A|nr:FtsX-like permease family protein [Phytoactinopolyspora limicola]